MTDPFIPAGAASVDTTPIGSMFSQLIEDVDRFVRAELRLQRAKVHNRLVLSRGAIVMALTAVMIVQAAVGALLVGLIISFSHALTPLGATALVVVVALVLAGLLAWGAMKALAAATAPEVE